MNKFFKILTATIILSVFTPLTSCDVMYESMMNPYGGYGYGYYSPYYGGGGNNNYLLDPNYAMWQAQQQQAQTNAVQQQLINTSIQQTEQQEREEYMRMTGGKITYEEWLSIKAQAAQDNSNKSSSQTMNNSNNNKHGSYTKDETCHLCHGDGKCSTCNGKHWYYGIGGSKITCPNCKPDGRCWKCKGTGKIAKTVHY